MVLCFSSFLIPPTSLACFLCTADCLPTLDLHQFIKLPNSCQASCFWIFLLAKSNLIIPSTDMSCTHLMYQTHMMKSYLESTIAEHGYDTQKYHCGQYSSSYDNSSSCHPTSSPSNSDMSTRSENISILLLSKGHKGQQSCEYRCNVVQTVHVSSRVLLIIDNICHCIQGVKCCIFYLF